MIFNLVVSAVISAVLLFNLFPKSLDLEPEVYFKLINTYENITKHELDTWLSSQSKISIDKIIRNIADPSLNSSLKELDPTVSNGVIVASKSKQSPDYYFQWIRDEAIVLNALINLCGSEIDVDFSTTFELYLENNYNLQRIDNLSGNVSSYMNLGEPKFLVTSQPFDEPWGRPQNDGPALRSIAIANLLLGGSKTVNRDGTISHATNWSTRAFEDIVKNDLLFINKYWNSTSFDLWEEVDSFHFFTSLTQLKAVGEGIRLVQQLEPANTKFLRELNSTFTSLLDFLVRYVDYDKNMITETPLNLSNRPSGLDISVILACLVTHDSHGSKFSYFNVDNLRILNTLNELISSMSILYPINSSKLGTNLGIAVGRYPEDVYDGVGISQGNPWFLATCSVSELLFKLIVKLVNDGKDLKLDPRLDAFYYTRMFSSTQGEVVIPYKSVLFASLIQNLFRYSDSFLLVVKEHIDNTTGSLSEQFNRNTGFMQGAEDLTWSHAALLNALRARNAAVAALAALH